MEIQNISTALFNKLRGQFPSVTVGDAEGNVTNDPKEARFFDFDYTKEGKSFGKISISISEDQGLVVLHSTDIISEADPLTKEGWYNFLKELRNSCTKNKTILIFDEVMTGFRVARGGVQELLGITPDLTALGKIVGGGLPVGVYGGKAEIMNNISPDGPVYQAGTLSGNPIAVSAGAALLKQLANKEIYTSMEKNAQKFLNPIKEYADELDIPFSFNVRGGMFGFFFSNSLPKNFDDVQNTNIELFSTNNSVTYLVSFIGIFRSLAFLSKVFNIVLPVQSAV